MDVTLLKRREENAEHADEDRGSRIEDRGSRIEDRGSRIEDRGSRIEDRGSRIEDRGSRIASSRGRRASIFDPRSSILFRVFCALFSMLLLTASGAQGQSNDKELLPDRLGERWRAAGPGRVLDAERLSSLSNADVLREYGLQR